ncbi:extracellular solute-binding protein [Conexibacter sp. JD483]|uniref:ABC transporter substrate-binding protein n=1 Tax=unclassified Conexibacter TaxID=2627773 RepID=UPI002716BA9D|nr:MULTISPECIES: extracellular solute-binding protein [unclassified Conexibacter]MDO8187352.1 extracellular solute-binding protein [Conexibacter sp. CPCC 205706]MDO8200515.1 extracellular solute-binding protein [Conexibacter sp. CPCC 205762]MDR9370016.1 extracellular solute-binding protein [Conexibacter sp. JD483]
METKLDRRQFVRRIGGTALAAGLGGSLLSACGSSDADSGASGGSGGSGEIGGTVTAMAWGSYLDAGVLRPFTGRHGVKIANQRLATNEEIFSRLKAGGLGKIDLATPNIAYTEQLVRAGLLQPIDFDRLRNADLMVPAMKDAIRTAGTVDGKAYAIPVAWGFDGMVYNTTKLKTAPTSWRDILRPELKGKVLLPEGPGPTFEIWPAVLGYDMTTLTKPQLAEVTDYVIKLKKTQVRTITGDPSDMAQLLSTGDIWVTGSGTWFGTSALVNQRNADEAKSIIPSDGGSTWIDTYVIARDAPNLDATYALIDFMLSTAAQTAMADSSGNATVNEAAIARVDSSNVALYGYRGDNIGGGAAPIFQYPQPDKGFTTPTDWNDAWARIAAA